MNRVVTPVAQEWAPLSLASMRHVMTQVRGLPDLSDDILARAADHFLAPAQTPVHFAAQRRTLGATTLLLMTVSALKMRGTESAGFDRFVDLGFVLSGAATLTPRGGESVRVGPGGSCVISDWSYFDVESVDGTRALHVMLQHERLADRGVRLSSARFNIDGSRSLRSPLRGFALAIADASWSASMVGEIVAERTIEDLAVGMFLEADGFAMDSEDLRAGLRGRALTEISVNHRTTDFNPATVADRLSVSLRHLQRAFENSGQSVARAIAGRRAESAALLLVAPGAASMTMQEIARSSGFTSVFELRAAFRDKYRMLPSEYRDGRMPVPQDVL